MYYLNSRYYNPEIGRFINADGLIGETGNILGHNLYAYAKNNPVMMIDSSGYLPKWLKVAGTALIVGGLGAAVGYGYSVVKGIKPIGKTASSLSKGAGNAGQGFDTFKAAKKHLGSPGKDNQWHHIVEQSQIKRSGFSPTQIHNTNNLTPVDKTIHGQITGHYNSKPSYLNGQTVRDWLTGQSFQNQYDYGINVLRSFGV